MSGYVGLVLSGPGSFYSLGATKDSWMFLIKTNQTLSALPGLDGWWLDGGDEGKRRIGNFSQVFGLSHSVDTMPRVQIKDDGGEKKS